jgi:GcrA cell cycle regulator
LELRQLVWSRSKCCWPTGDPKKNGFKFCGDTVVPGKPYCLPHCQEAYTTSRDAS